MCSVSNESGGNKRLVVHRRDAVTVDLNKGSGLDDQSIVEDSQHVGLDGKFVVPAKRVAQLKEELGMTSDELIKSLITPASALARPPISTFHVGYVVFLAGLVHDVYLYPYFMVHE